MVTGPHSSLYLTGSSQGLQAAWSLPAQPHPGPPSRELYPRGSFHSAPGEEGPPVRLTSSQAWGPPPLAGRHLTEVAGPGREAGGGSAGVGNRSGRSAPHPTPAPTPAPRLSQGAMCGIEPRCQYIESTNVCWVPALCWGPGETRGPQRARHGSLAPGHSSSGGGSRS